MIDAIAQDIQASIAQNLPAAMGEVLRKRLQKAEMDAELVVELRADADKDFTRIKNLEEQVRALQGQLAGHKALDERERAVDEAERKQEIFALKTKLEASEGSRDFARNVALGLVRNTEFRESVHHSTTTPVPVTNAGYTNVQSHTTHDNNNVTKTAA